MLIAAPAGHLAIGFDSTSVRAAGADLREVSRRSCGFPVWIVSSVSTRWVERGCASTRQARRSDTANIDRMCWT